MDVRPYRASELAQWARCGMQFFLQHMEERKPEFTPSYIALGSAVHRMIETIHREELWGATAAQVGMMFDSAWQSVVLTSPPIHFRERDTLTGIKGDAMDMVLGYSFDPRNRDAKVLRVEKTFAFEKDGIKLQGTPDQFRQLEDGSFWIVDLKSGAGRPSLFVINLWLQPYIYALAAQQEGLKVSQVTWVHLRDYIPYKINSKTRGIVKGAQRGPAYYTIPITEEGIDGAWREMSKFVHAVREGRFERRPSNQVCSSCAFRAPCLRDFNSSVNVDSIIGGPAIEAEDFEQ